MMREDLLNEFQALLLKMIKATIAKSIVWENAKKAMLENHPFTETIAYRNFIEFNNDAQRVIKYEKSYFCELSSSENERNKVYVFLPCVKDKNEGEMYEFYYCPDTNRINEFPMPELQSMLKRLYNAIVFGQADEEDTEKLPKIIIPDQ